jgi:DNA-binding CsgD family transcriptional regulator
MELALGVQETLHGRSADLAAVPPTGTLVLCGEPGIGKSALVRAAVAGANGTVLSAPGNPDETDLPYAGLQRLLAPVAGPPDTLRDALDGRTPTAGRLTLGLATLTVLRRAAPVLVVLDDADLLDDASWDVLTVAARRIAADPITVLATASTEDRAVGLPVRRLAGLDADAARDLLRDRAPGLPGDVAAALIELAGGNPAALIDLTAALTPGQRRGTEPPPVTLPAGSPLARAYRRALGALPADSRWILLLAAAGEDLDAADLVAAAVAAGTDPAALEPAESTGLIEVAGGAVTFRSPALRAAVYYGAPIGRRRAAHATLAETLTARGARLRGMLHRAAAASGPDERLAADLVAAAADGPHRTASAAYEHAAGLTGDAAALVAAARHAWQGGQPHRAAQLLRRLAPAPAGTLVEARAAVLEAEMAAHDEELLAAAERLIPYDLGSALEALLLAGEARYVAGDHVGFQRVVARVLGLRRGLDLAGVGLAVCRGLGVGGVGLAACREIDPAGVEVAVRRGVEPAGTEMVFRYVAGLAAMLTGDHVVAFAELRRMVRLADRVDEPAALVHAARAALLVGDGPGARRLALRAASLARFRDEVAQVPRALEAAAFADLSAGRHDDAAASAGEGATLARATGQAGLAESHLGVLAVLAALTGDREATVLRIRAADARDTAEGPSQARALCSWALALLDLLEGRPLASADRLRTLVATPAGRGNVVLQVAVTPHLVEAASRCSEPICVDDVGTAFDRWAGATGTPTWLALRERCRALRAADARAADRHFGEALRQHSAGDSDFARAHTELLYGRSLRRRRRPAAAREHLRRSVETFRLLDLGVWAAQADVELRAAGEHVATAVPPAALTAQQQRIARLVADGATNREVAQQLFLSPRTIDHHLRNIFVRLGVRSRTELARRVAAGQ